MKTRTKVRYTNEAMGRPKVIPDFLPPEELVLKEDNVKVTITLSRASVAFFKRQAKKQHTPYQKMVRLLLDLYSSQHG